MLILLLLARRGGARLSLLCWLLLIGVVRRCGASGLSWRLKVAGYVVWSLGSWRWSTPGSGWMRSLELGARLFAECRRRLGAQRPLVLLWLVIAIVAAVVHVPRWLYSGLRARVRLRAREAHARVGLVLLMLLRRERARGHLVATPALLLVCGDLIVVVRICVASWATGRGRVAHGVCKSPGRRSG